MKRIVLYDRHQLFDGKIPEAHQSMVDDIKEKLTSEGNEIVAVFTDTCSEHVPLLERPEFSKMYRMCTNDEEVEIHITSMSRISRKISWITKMCDQMHSLGYVVTFENEGITSKDLTKSPVMEKVYTAVEQEIGM